MQALYNDVWSNLKQGVLEVATKENGNHHVQEAIELTGQYISNGMQWNLFFISLLYSYSIIQCNIQ